MSIDKKRDSAKTFTVGDDSDQSACVMMVGINDAMYIIKENSIWKFQLADNIDPERKTETLPDTTQKFLSYGAKSEIVSRTLIQANELLKKGNAPDSINIEACLAEVLRVTTGIANLLDIIDKINADFSRAREIIRANSQKPTMPLPTFEGLDNEWSAALNCLDDIRSGIRQLAFLFYPSIRRNEKWFVDLREKLTFEAFDMFDTTKHTEALDAVDHDLGFARWLRNSKSHPKDGQRAVLWNYRLMPDGNAAPPSVTIENVKREAKDIDLVSLLTQLSNAMLFSFEMVLLWLCGSNQKLIMGQQVQIYRRGESDIKVGTPPYCYAIELGGQIKILG